jgi:hypothetical protein
MTKSEFYKIWYSTRLPGQELNEEGYPNLTFKGDLITTEEKWQEFLETEINLEEFVRLSEEACEILGVEYVKPYKDARIYPQITEQLDGIYKTLLAIKNSGVGIGTEGTAYLDSITAVKEEFPKN